MINCIDSLHPHPHPHVGCSTSFLKVFFFLRSMLQTHVFMEIAPQTSTTDILLRMSKSSLSIEMRTQPVAPPVIQGNFPEAVDNERSSWVFDHRPSGIDLHYISMRALSLSLSLSDSLSLSLSLSVSFRCFRKVR
jgi:hypothetical protein